MRSFFSVALLGVSAVMALPRAVNETLFERYEGILFDTLNACADTSVPVVAERTSATRSLQLLRPILQQTRFRLPLSLRLPRRSMFTGMSSPRARRSVADGSPILKLPRPSPSLTTRTEVSASRIVSRAQTVLSTPSGSTPSLPVPHSSVP